VSYTITVHGTPAGQGAISYGRHGKGYHRNGKALRAWRNAIAQAARQTIPEPLPGPIKLKITVTIQKPKTAPRRRQTWPITRHSTDWDHHGRAASDALTGIAYHDDSQIVDGRARKVYPGEDPDALPHPGAIIHITPLGDAT
jgi:Holliday junction resolvase RusA-like endonuclease